MAHSTPLVSNKDDQPILWKLLGREHKEERKSKRVRDIATSVCLVIRKKWKHTLRFVLVLGREIKAQEKGILLFDFHYFFDFMYQNGVEIIILFLS